MDGTMQAIFVLFVLIVRTRIMQRLSEEPALPKVHPSETENR